MDKLREKLSPEDIEGVIRSHSKYKTSNHPYGLHCRECGEVYYVDEDFYHKTSSILQFDPSNNPFICERCEDTSEENPYRQG